MLKNEKGATLITLLLALIVLLVLAGTVVFLVFGKNGVLAESEIIKHAQDKNYAEGAVTIGLRALERQIKQIEDGNTNTTLNTSNNGEKMDLLIEILGQDRFEKESDAVLIYKYNDNSYRITINMNNYTLTNVE